MEGPWRPYAKWNKLDRESQILHDLTYMWNLKKIKKQGHRKRWDVVTGDRGWGEEKLKKGGQSHRFPDMINKYWEYNVQCDNYN